MCERCATSYVLLSDEKAEFRLYFSAEYKQIIYTDSEAEFRENIGYCPFCGRGL